MARPRNLPALDRTQGGRPAPSVGPEIRDAERTLPGAMSVPIEQIVPDPTQPRYTMDPAGLADLAASLQEHGVLQPLLVREDGYMEDGRTRYMIVAGGRRYVAAQQAGLARLPVVVRDSEGATRRVMQLVENIQRQDLTPLEEARAFQELMDAEGMTAAALAARLHISPQKVRDRVLLLTDQLIADAVQRGQITSTTARDVLRMADEMQAPLRASIAAGVPIDGAAIQAARAHAAAAGVVNPRSKGGGRAARRHVPKDAEGEAATPIQEHTPYVPDAAPPPRATTADAAIDGLEMALRVLGDAPLEPLFRYGIERGWTCQELWQELQARRQRRGSVQGDEGVIER